MSEHKLSWTQDLRVMRRHAVTAQRVEDAARRTTGGECLPYKWAHRKQYPDARRRWTVNPMDDIRGLCLDQIAAAMAALQATSIVNIRAHDLRTELQRGRAMLRLLRPCLGNRAYHKNNRALRDAARILTPVRDAQMLLQIITEMAREGDDGDIREFRSLLACQLTRDWQQCRRLQRPIPTIFLRQVQQRMKRVSVVDWDAKSEFASPTEAYIRCRQSFRHAHAKSTDERLHEWRKQVKYFVYQLEALASARGYFGLLHQLSSRLADCLGSDHDLAVLQQRMPELLNSSTHAYWDAAKDVWKRRISHRRSHLQREAWHLAARIYAKKPGRFQKHWKATVCVESIPWNDAGKG